MPSVDESPLPALGWRIHIVIRHALLWLVSSSEQMAANNLVFPPHLCSWRKAKLSSESRAEKGEQGGETLIKDSQEKHSYCSKSIDFIVGRNLRYEGRQLTENLSFPSFLMAPKILSPSFSRLSFLDAVRSTLHVETCTMHVDLSTVTALPALLPSLPLKSVHVKLYNVPSEGPPEFIDSWFEENKEQFALSREISKASLMEAVTGRRLEAVDHYPFYREI